MKWIVAIVLFGLLIFFHEFGHFIIAKINGVQVEEFSIGFGPRLLSTTIGGTKYSLKLFVFGGSCMMKGMLPEGLIEEDEDEDEESDTEEADASANEADAAVQFVDRTNEEDEDSFNSKSVGRRLAIIFAGPFFNFLLAFIAAVILISVMGYDPARVSYVAEDSNAEAAGLEVGDRIISVNGKHISIGRDVEEYYTMHSLSADEEIELTVERDGEKMEISFLPDSEKCYMLGISYYADEEEAVLTAVSDDSPAESAGLKAGDVIVRIDETDIASGEELAEYMDENPPGESTYTIYYERNNSQKKTEVTPEVMDKCSLGYYYFDGRDKTNAIGVLKYSVIEVRYWIGAVMDSLKMLITGKYGIDTLSGPVGVVDVIGETYENSSSEGALYTWMNMLYLLILLSANVGVMNLLPFPVLDGGRIVFLLIEGITGRKVNPKVEAAISFAGAVLIIGLAVFVMYQDIMGLF